MLRVLAQAKFVPSLFASGGADIRAAAAADSGVPAQDATDSYRFETGKHFTGKL